MFLEKDISENLKNLLIVCVEATVEFFNILLNIVKPSP